jgi:hypothetical protein
MQAGKLTVKKSLPGDQVEEFTSFVDTAVYTKLPPIHSWVPEQTPKLPYNAPLLVPGAPLRGILRHEDVWSVEM